MTWQELYDKVTRWATTQFFRKSEYSSTSTGSAQKARPVILGSNGKLSDTFFNFIDGDGDVDAAYINDADVDHGSVGGLGDDDHTQYVLVSGSRAMTGTLTINKNDIALIAAGDEVEGGMTTGQLQIRGGTDSNKRLVMGYDTTNDYGWIQPGISGTGFRSLYLCQNGGDVAIGMELPSEKLHVEGALRVQGTEGADGYIYLYSDQGDDNADRFRFHVTSGLLTAEYYNGSWNAIVDFDSSGLYVNGNLGGDTLGESYTAVSYNTGWADYNSTTTETVGYRKFGDTVMLKGCAKRTSGVDDTIFTLPSGYRPSKSRNIGVLTGNSSPVTFGAITVDSAGAVVLADGADTLVSLEGIAFNV